MINKFKNDFIFICFYIRIKINKTKLKNIAGSGFFRHCKKGQIWTYFGH